MPTILRTVDLLASHHVPQLVVGLMISEAALLLVSDDALALAFFLVQRVSVTILIWPQIGESLAMVSAASLLAIVLLGGATRWRVRRMARRASTRSGLVAGIPVRALSLSLAAMALYGLLPQFSKVPWPLGVSLVVVSLVLGGLLLLLLGSGTLRAGLGVMMLADSGRIVYALVPPEPVIWGLWSACDVVVALAASYLHGIRVTALVREPAGR